MIPYGLPKIGNWEKPDCFDGWLFGLKGFNIYSKRATRRIWKKRERARVRQFIHNFICGRA